MHSVHWIRHDLDRTVNFIKFLPLTHVFNKNDDVLIIIKYLRYCGFGNKYTLIFFYLAVIYLIQILLQKKTTRLMALFSLAHSITTVRYFSSTVQLSSWMIKLQELYFFQYNLVFKSTQMNC